MKKIIKYDDMSEASYFFRYGQIENVPGIWRGRGKGLGLFSMQLLAQGTVALFYMALSSLYSWYRYLLYFVEISIYFEILLRILAIGFPEVQW